MTPPKTTSELISQHPALAAFRDYIREQSPREPPPEEIVVSNEYPQDGKLEMSYIDVRGHFFLAQLDASRSSGALELLHGHMEGRNKVRDDARRENVANACQTLHDLGGQEEDSFHCPDPAKSKTASSASSFSQKAVWLGKLGFYNWTGAEALRPFANPIINYVWKFRLPSPTAYLLRSFRPWMQPIGTNEMALAERGGIWGPTLGAGALGAFVGEGISDGLGLDSNYHHQERFALDVVSAYGAMQGMRWFLRRSNAANISLPSFGAGLLTSALVDATLGQIWEEGSHQRQIARVGAFLLPEVYRMAFGNRSLAIAESRAGSAIGRYGTKILKWGFCFDVGYMILHHLSSNNLETGRDNLLYRRATQLQSEQQHPLVWLLHGAAGVVAPALTERYLVGGRYVEEARLELEAQSANTVDGASSFLRHALLTGPTGLETDPRFYRELDLSWLRGDNTLRNILRPDGRELPVADVAEQLSDPEIYHRYIEGSSHKQLVDYVQREFRGRHLSREDVEEILDRIHLHRVRQDLHDLPYTAGSEQRAFVACFDSHGIRPGQEQALLSQIFPGQALSTEQLLALRRVALARRILELQASDPLGQNPQLAAYTRVAREIGLMDAEGQLVPSEETQWAQDSIVHHPPAAPAAPAIPTQREIVLGILAYGTKSSN